MNPILNKFLNSLISHTLVAALSLTAIPSVFSCQPFANAFMNIYS